MITACVAQALQRCMRRVFACFLLILHGVRKIEKTCNQLSMWHACWRQDAVLVPGSDPAMHAGSSDPSEVIMARSVHH